MSGCVSGGVGHGLDRDPVRRRLDRGGESTQVGGRHRDCEARHGSRMLLQCAGQPQFVQRWRAQVVRQPPDVVDEALRPVAYHDERICRTARIGLHQAALPRSEARARRWPARPRRAGPAQPAPLLFAGEDEPLPGALQVLLQPELTRGCAYSASQIVEQPPIGSAEGSDGVRGATRSRPMRSPRSTSGQSTSRSSVSHLAGGPLRREDRRARVRR